MLFTGFFSLSIGRYLISQGAHVGAVNSEGDTPLDIAEEEAMEELLQNEVNRQGNFEYRRVLYLCIYVFIWKLGLNCDCWSLFSKESCSILNVQLSLKRDLHNLTVNCNCFRLCAVLIYVLKPI